MKKFLYKLRKSLKNNLTIVLVPHTTSRTKKVTFSLSFILFMVMLWSGVTIWAGYLAGQHIDYWRIQLDRELIQLKLMFFADQIKKSQELLEDVRQKDEQLRALLDMKTKKAIIVSANDGKGGPNPKDKEYLDKYLNKKIDEVPVSELKSQITGLREKANEIIISADEINKYVVYQKLLYTAMPNMFPTTGNITSMFGFRIHPITGKYDFHTGIDIADSKNTQVRATARGTVKFCGWMSGYGRLIIVDHGMGYETYYAHLNKILVKPDQNVLRGECVGFMGETGTSTGIHLHYEININGKAANPTRYFDKESFFNIKERKYVWNR